MAEYCNTCADKLGTKPDAAPGICEGCGKSLPKGINWLLVGIVGYLLTCLFLSLT